MSKRNAFYAQSGGVTAVINASACGVIETARRHRNVDRQSLRGTQRHHRRTARRVDRHQQGIGACDRGAAQHAVRRIRIVSSQVEVVRDGSARVPATDRGLQGARHRLFLLQRRRRLAGHGQQGGAIQRAARLSDHLHRRSEDGRQRSAVHRHVSRLRFGRQIRRGIDPRSGARRRQHVRDVDEGIRDGGDGAARGLDRRGRRSRAGQSPDGAPHIILFPEIAFDRATFIAKVERRCGARVTA